MFEKVLRKALICLLASVMLLTACGCKNSADNSSSGSVPHTAAENESEDKKQSDGKESSTDKKKDNKKNESSNSKNTETNSKTNSENKSSKNPVSEREETEEFHKYTSWKSVSEYYHSSKCVTCGKTEKIIHIWNDGAVVTKPTKSANGTLKFTCQLCGGTKTEKISYTALYGDDYSAGRKTAETYQAASTRKLKIFGASYSDDNFAALYGECPVGLGVLVQTKDGCFNVDSNMGNFALRMESEEYDTEIDISLWYRGKQIGKNETKSINIITSDYDEDDEGWKPMLGYDNLGYFEKIYHYYNRYKTYTQYELDNCTSKYTSRLKTLKQINSNAEIICVLAPSALRVYGGVHETTLYKSPDGYDLMVKALEKADVTVINLEKTFQKHKYDKLPIYNKYDTHWTDYGAYLAYVEMYKQISQKFPAAAPRKFSDFKWTEGYFYGSDIPSYFGIDEKPGKYISEYTVRREMTSKAPQVIKNINRFKLNNSVAYDSYSDEAMKKKVYNTGNSALPNVSVIRNSYGVQIQDIIAERSNVAVINAMWDYKFNVSQYNQYKTDYIIYVLSEWEFDRIINN